MLDMGFIHDIKKVLALLPRDRQSLLFSATFSPDIRALAERLLQLAAVGGRGAAQRRRGAGDARSSTPWTSSQKRALLSHLVRSRRIHQALVFTRTKHGANRLAEQLQRDGIEAMAIHGNKSQGARVRALVRVQGRRHPGAGGHGHRGPRHRHRPAAARRELRAAQRARGLRPPHRADGTRGRRRHGRLARLRGRGAVPAGHREAAQGADRARGRGRVRARPGSRRPGGRGRGRRGPRDARVPDPGPWWPRRCAAHGCRASGAVPWWLAAPAAARPAGSSLGAGPASGGARVAGGPAPRPRARAPASGRSGWCPASAGSRRLPRAARGRREAATGRAARPRASGWVSVRPDPRARPRAAACHVPPSRRRSHPRVVRVPPLPVRPEPGRRASVRRRAPRSGDPGGPAGRAHHARSDRGAAPIGRAPGLIA